MTTETDEGSAKELLHDAIPGDGAGISDPKPRARDRIPAKRRPIRRARLELYLPIHLPKSRGLPILRQPPLYRYLL